MYNEDGSILLATQPWANRQRLVVVFIIILVIIVAMFGGL